jgi:hypothetical protein
MKRALIILLVLVHASLAAAASNDSDIDVKVAKDGQLVEVDVILRVQASRADTWRVLTDYNDMVRFASSLTSSAIVRRDGNALEVAQTGNVRFGLLSFPFESTRRIELEPYREIRSYLIAGDMKTSRFTTRIIDEGSSTRIEQHGEVVADLWVPPWIGPAIIAARTRKQWQEVREEILRRKTHAAGIATSVEPERE